MFIHQAYCQECYYVGVVNEAPRKKLIDPSHLINDFNPGVLFEFSTD